MAGIAVDRGQGITNDGERTIAEQVDFHQSRIFGLVLFPLNHGEPRCRPFHRNIAADLVGDQHHAARVQAEMAEMSLQLPRPEENVRPRRVEAQGRADLCGPCLQGGVGRHLHKIGSAVQEIQGLADFSRGQAVHLGNFPHGRPRRQGVLIRDHGRLMRPIAGKHPFENLGALVPGKVDIDIRWVMPPGIEKPFKQQVMSNRIDVGDAEAVGHNGRGRRASPARSRRLTDNLIDDQKIVGKPCLSDDGELLLDALANDLREHAVPPDGSLVGLGSQRLESAVRGHLTKGGKDRGLEIPSGGALVRDATGIAERLRDMRQGASHD